jgi:hypothetical protein
MNQCVSCIHLFGCLLMVWILFSWIILFDF